MSSMTEPGEPARLNSRLERGSALATHGIAAHAPAAGRLRALALAGALVAALAGCTAVPNSATFAVSHSPSAEPSTNDVPGEKSCDALARVLTEYDTWTAIEPPASYAAAWAVATPACVVAPSGGKFFTVLFAQPADTVSAALLAAGWGFPRDMTPAVATPHVLGPLSLALQDSGAMLAADPDISGAFRIDLSGYSAWVGYF